MQEYRAFFVVGTYLSHRSNFTGIDQHVRRDNTKKRWSATTQQEEAGSGL